MSWLGYETLANIVATGPYTIGSAQSAVPEEPPP